LGSLTGYNAAKIGFGERLRGGPNSNMTRFGKPWTYVLRDTLQFAHNLDDAITNLANADRICSIYLGLGSGSDNAFRIIEYSEKELNIFDDHNWHFDEGHPQIDNLIWKEYRAGENCFKNVL